MTKFEMVQKIIEICEVEDHDYRMVKYIKCSICDEYGGHHEDCPIKYLKDYLNARTYINENMTTKDVFYNFANKLFDIHAGEEWDEESGPNLCLRKRRYDIIIESIYKIYIEEKDNEIAMNNKWE